jgi:hypothetical protein
MLDIQIDLYEDKVANKHVTSGATYIRVAHHLVASTFLNIKAHTHQLTLKTNHKYRWPKKKQMFDSAFTKWNGFLMLSSLMLSFDLGGWVESNFTDNNMQSFSTV